MNHQRYKVVVVDDENAIKQSLRKMIEEDGSHFAVVGEARNGLEALQLVDRVAPNVIITDIRMPVMNGIKLIEEVKKYDPGIEFVIVSGFDEFEYARQALRFGAFDYLLKPLKPKHVHSTLRRIYERFQEEDNRLREKMTWLNDGKPYAKQLADDIWLLNAAKTKKTLSEIHTRMRANINPTFSLKEICSLFFALVDDELKQKQNHSQATPFGKTLSDRITETDFSYPSIEAQIFEVMDNLRSRRNQVPSEYVRNAVRFIQQHYRQCNLTLQDIADHINISASHLRNIFKEEIGTNPISFLTAHRIEMAKSKLADPFCKIYEVANDVGYAEYAHFSRVFKKYTRFSPTEYRKTLG